MEFSNQKGLITAQDQIALSWLWRSYLRRYILAIGLIFSLITTYGLALVGFLAMINSNLGSLFSSDTGVFLFSESTSAAHHQGENRDANGDGIYDFLIEVRIDDETSFTQMPFSLSPDPKATAAPGLVPYDMAFSDEGALALTPAKLKDFLEISNASFGSILGSDSSHLIFTSEGSGRILFRLSLILLAAALVRVISAYSSGRIAEWVTARASLDIRRDLITRIMSLDLSYFDKAQSGAIVLCLNDLVKAVQSFFSISLLNAGKAATTILSILGYLAWMHFGLFLVVAITFPLAFFGIRSISNRLRRYMQSGLVAFANFLTNIETTIGGIRTIKLTNQSARAHQSLIDDAQEMAEIQIRISRYTTLIAPMVDLLAALAIMGGIILGGLAVINGWAGLTAGTLFTFVIGFALIFSPASRLSGFNAMLLTTLVALQAIYNMMQQHPKIVDREDAVGEFDAGGDIEIKGVHFAYGDTSDQALFTDLNLCFAGGKTSALVGQTGSGKTTIFSLIARLYEPESGEISIGGQEIRSIKASALRDAFSVVTQEAFLFDGTIEDNIRFVYPEASDAQVARAAQKAQLSDVIAEKAGTTVGPRGAQLSGGQKQRISIARAFLKEAPIILLDEATSALDQKTEEKITLALRELCENKTTIIIAHRLSTVTHADEIFVLEEGKVTEKGSHDHLMAREGLYAALYRAQQGSQT